jgi:[protein-PII] uridylyltransferase
MASIGANIVDARITTMRNGMALDSFWVHEPKLNYSEKMSSTDYINSAIEKSLNGVLKINDAIRKRPGNFPKRARSMTTAPRVLIDNKASTTHTVLEVNGTDRPGLLHQLTRKIAQQNLQINSAKISTYGTSIVDVFYVKDLFGLKIQSDRRINLIKKYILDELKSHSDVVMTEIKPDKTK